MRGERTETARSSARARGALKLALAALLLGGAAALSAAPWRPGVTAEAAFEPGFVRAAFAPDGPTFSHSTPQHAALSCNSCHRRADNSPRPAMPGHKSCTDCHLQQFITPGAQLCANCHTNLDSRNPPVKPFPALRSFNARFDHAAHETGAGRPAEGCASCHQPMRRGVALSIPAGLDTHSNCFQCHTPNASAGGRDLSSCGACHSPGPYRRTGIGARAFRVGFSHAQHGARKGLSCAECHTVRAGAPQGRQVTSPQPTQHFGSPRAQSCMTCHNNRRAFGGDDFKDCKRCHTGPTFRL
jgi:c(7)-type cytochrome triheme protein